MQFFSVLDYEEEDNDDDAFCSLEFEDPEYQEEEEKEMESNRLTITKIPRLDSKNSINSNFFESEPSEITKKDIKKSKSIILEDPSY